MNTYAKSRAIVPLAAAKLAGITIRGFQAHDGRSGMIVADSITKDGEAISVFVECRDLVVVKWGPKDSYAAKPKATFELLISDEGAFELRSPESRLGLGAGDRAPTWR